VLIFSAGVNARPTADGYTTIGVLGEPGAAERMFAAIERGALVNTDLSDKWGLLAPGRAADRRSTAAAQHRSRRLKGGNIS
jgi:hypothetical protein